jgi:hypothetical protein
MLLTHQAQDDDLGALRRHDLQRVVVVLLGHLTVWGCWSCGRCRREPITPTAPAMPAATRLTPIGRGPPMCAAIWCGPWSVNHAVSGARLRGALGACAGRSRYPPKCGPCRAAACDPLCRARATSKPRAVSPGSHDGTRASSFTSRESWYLSWYPEITMSGERVLVRTDDGFALGSADGTVRPVAGPGEAHARNLSLTLDVRGWLVGLLRGDGDGPSRLVAGGRGRPTPEALDRPVCRHACREQLGRHGLPQRAAGPPSACASG